MLDPFDSSHAAKLVAELAAQKSLAPAKKVLQKAAAQARKSWLDSGPLCHSALAAAAAVATARGWPGKSPTPEMLDEWLAKVQPKADDDLAALAAEVVEKLRTNSILQDIAGDVGDRSFKPGCADLVKRLQKPAKALGSPPVAKGRQPAEALSPAAARKLLEKRGARFEKYDGRLTFIARDESVLTDENLAILGQVSDLGQANLGDKKSRFSAAGLAHLAGLKKLESLGLRHIATDEMLAVVSEMHGLRSLSIYYATKITDASLRRLAKLTQLEELEIGRTACDGRGLAHVAPGKLKFLELTELKISPEGAKAIARCTKLSELRIPFSTVPKGFFKALAGLKQLNTINVVSARGIDDAALADLGKLVSLRELNLYGVQDFASGALAKLSGLKNLETLDLRSTRVEEAGLAEIAALPKLRELDLEGSKLNDAGLASLAKSKSLRTLSVKQCPVTAAGVASLATVKSLRELNLFGTNLSDDAAPHLAKMVWLTELDLRNAGISPKAQAAIRRALKKTEVEYDR
jgi:hypothetical protein